MVIYFTSLLGISFRWKGFCSILFKSMRDSLNGLQPFKRSLSLLELNFIYRPLHFTEIVLIPLDLELAPSDRICTEHMGKGKCGMNKTVALSFSLQAMLQKTLRNQ